MDMQQQREFVYKASTIDLQWSLYSLHSLVLIYICTSNTENNNFAYDNFVKYETDNVIVLSYRQ